MASFVSVALSRFSNDVGDDDVRSSNRRRMCSVQVMFLLGFLSVFGSADLGYAHQPRITAKSLTKVENPEVSQAFYGELKGQPHYYRIESAKPFRLYVGILVPDIKGIKKNVSAQVSKGRGHKADSPEHEDEEERPFFVLDGLEHNWTRYYEEFAGDNYYFGPELKAKSTEGDRVPRGIRVDEGTYTIKVFNPANKGKYVLVVGDQEQFPLSEIMRTVITLPWLKSEFFGKSPFTAFLNLTGLFLLGFLIIVAVLITAVVWLIKRLIRRRVS